MINLLSKTGLGRSGHGRSQSFGSILYVSGPKLSLNVNSRWFCMVLRGETQKTQFWDQRIWKSTKNQKKYNKNPKHYIGVTLGLFF